MRRYRSNVRSDAARLEEMSKKNGECKKAKRDLQRQAIQSGNTKLEKKIKMQRNTRSRRIINKFLNHCNLCTSALGKISYVFSLAVYGESTT
jgi:hypothetical protein